MSPSDPVDLFPTASHAALADLLFKSDAVQFGAFRLKKHEVAEQKGEEPPPLSPYFFNLRVPQNPKPGPLTPEIVQMAADLMFHQVTHAQVYFEAVCGVPRAGDPFAQALARINMSRAIILHKEEGQGTRQVASITDRAGVRSGETVLLVDDLITGADSKLEAITVLRPEFVVTDVVVLIDREQGGGAQLARSGVTLHAVFTVTQLLEYYLARGDISSEKYGEAMAYLASEQMEARS